MNARRLLLLLTLVLTARLAFAQYPLLPQNQQHYINGTVGEERGGRNRYHYGLDMASPNGTPVYSIEAGTYNAVNGAVAVGHYAYVHVINHPPAWVDEVTPVEANQFIGEVTAQHVHLQQSTGDLTNITGFEEQNQTAWINPIGNLNPLDIVAPDIDEARLYRQGNNNGAHITNTLTLFGQIDLRVNVEDARVNADGTGNGFGVAPYTINWEVLDLTNTVLHAYTGLSFANVPTNASALTLHGPNANWQTPNFEYWITNDAFNTPYDKYWNTLQHQDGAYNASAACPEQALLPEGRRVRVRVNACDYSNNCDQELLPNTADNYVIDNFKPYLKKVTVKYGNTTVYEATWDCTTACANGLHFNEVVHEKMLIDDVPNGFTIIAEGSEALSQLAFSIPSLGLNNLVASNISADQRTFTFTTGAITPAQFQYAVDRTLSFSGQDNNGNVLMALQTFKNAACVTIPTRTGNTTWSNPSNVPFNNDLTHVLPICPQISFSAGVLLFHPNGCNSTDGAIRLLTTGNIQPPNVFPNYTYTYHWEDEQGNVLVPSGPFLTNLGPGEYCQVLTDPYGCTGEDCKELTAQHYPEIYETITPACLGGGNVGSVEVYAFDQFGGTYTFDWSTGHHTAFDYYSTITNLAPGTYSVTISSDEASCTVVKTFTVPTIQPPAPLAVGFTSLQPCPGQNNGQINLTVSGGIPPYTYAWSDAPPTGVTNTRTQLMAENYISTVIDYCGAQVVTTIPLTPMQANAFTLTPACENQGTGSIQIANGNPGYTYVWNTNPTQSGTNVQNLRSGNICVIVTDNRGCKLTRCGDLRNKEYQIIEENRPCEGFNDGSLKLKVYNPLAELVQITLDGQAQPLLNPFATDITHLVPNLSSGASYSLVVTIGACTYNYPFTMQHKPVSNVFDHYNNDICYYDVYCGPNFIANDGYQQPPQMSFNDVNGGWLSRCSVDTYCGNTEVDDIKYSKKTVKAFIYYQILLDALVNSPHSSDYINSLIDVYNSKGLKYCDKVRYCPANLKITTTFPGTNGQAISSGGCWSLNCNWPVGDESFCMSSVVPNYFYSSGNPINPSLPPVYLCEPRTYSLYQLINWKDDLLATYPNFLNSELHDLVTQWEGIEPVDSRMYCASVGFCLTDFTVLYNNVESIDCAPCPEPSMSYTYSYGEPAPQPCDPEEGFTLTKVYCKGLFCSGGGCCLFPVSLLNDFPGETFFLTAPNDGLPPIRTEHGLPDRSDEFVNFGAAYDGGAFVPKGLFKNQQGKGLYYDYFPHNTSAEREMIPNIKFSLEDLDNNSLAYISKEDNVPKYYLSYEDFLQDWTIPIGASGFLEISHLSREGTQMLVAGRFQGTLTFGDQQVANATSVSAIVLRVSNTGALAAARTVMNFDANRPLTFERSGSNLLISGRTGTAALGTNGQTAIVGSQPGQYFTLRDPMNAFTYQYQSNNLNASSGMTLLRTAYSQSSGNRAYLFSGTGTVQINSQTIAQPTANQLTLVNVMPTGTLAWVNTVNISSYNATELDLTEGDNGSLFLGLTFTNTVTASNQSAISIGGKDVAILRYDPNGALTDIKSFGSTDDEEVKRCVFSEGNLYFGGNYHGLTFERLIGSNIYESYPSDSVYSKAYITFLPVNVFKDSTGHRLMVNSPRKPVATSTDVQAHPNPFTDKIQVSLHSNVVAEGTVQLVNALGITVWQRKATITEGQNVLTINDLQTLPTGIYVLHILAADNKIYTYKMQKQ